MQKDNKERFINDVMVQMYEIIDATQCEFLKMVLTKALMGMIW